MKTKLHLWTRCLAAIVIGGGMLGAGIPPVRAIEVNENSSEDVEVMTRGPVHEAFAEAVVFDPKPGIIVPKQPPTLIEEVMPDQRPTGDNVVWIPGYWGWDDELNDFLWISGVWRNLPPGREWVPGYWSPVDTGYQWTSGYWQDAETKEVAYLPEPPRSLERGPSVKASSDDETWIPGNWEYRNDHYAWRTGYWVTGRSNWWWTPSYYRWTPYGYVYVDGYWDYPVVNRGVAFAPVYYHTPYYERSDYYYTPMAAIALSVFWNHLFVNPHYGHYYYGDYYGSGYRDRYYAWNDYGRRYRGYDSIYAQARWENRADRNWVRERQRYYEYRRDNVDARPPRTWAALNRRTEVDRQRDDFGVVERYDRVVQRKNSSRRFQTVSSDERQQLVSQRNEIRNYARERQQREITAVRERGDKQTRTEVSRMKVSRSPLVAKRSDRSEQNGGPPARLESRASETGVSEKGAIASSDERNGKAAKGSRNSQESHKTKAGNADSRDKDAIAGKSVAEPNRESWTKPGQRRDDVASSKGKSQQSAESSRSSQGAASGKTEKATASAAPKNKAEPKREASSANRSANKQSASNDRKATTPKVQRKEKQSPKREATPQSQRKSVQPEARSQSARQETPSRKATPQRAQVKPQQKAQPQRQKAAPAVRQKPQRQKAAPTVKPEPQRQAARPAPQPQKAAPKQQSKAESGSRTETAADQKTEKKKKRQN